jgi:hypothetical protein
MLNTKTGSKVTSVVQNVTGGATTDATIMVNVNLLQGRRVIAGTYSNILTVTIDLSLEVQLGRRFARSSGRCSPREATASRLRP